jgi:hypothetical protein
MNFKKVSNQIMLITYADSMGKNLKELEEILTTQVKGAIGSITTRINEITAGPANSRKVPNLLLNFSLLFILSLPLPFLFRHRQLR